MLPIPPKLYGYSLAIVDKKNYSIKNLLLVRSDGNSYDRALIELFNDFYTKRTYYNPKSTGVCLYGADIPYFTQQYKYIKGIKPVKEAIELLLWHIRNSDLSKERLYLLKIG